MLCIGTWRNIYILNCYYLAWRILFSNNELSVRSEQNGTCLRHSFRNTFVSFLLCFCHCSECDSIWDSTSWNLVQCHVFFRTCYRFVVQIWISSLMIASAVVHQHCTENISTPFYVKCNEMYRSKVCVQEFSYFVPGLDIQLQQLENASPVRKKISCRWRNTTSHISFFSRNWYVPMA